MTGEGRRRQASDRAASFEREPVIARRDIRDRAPSTAPAVPAAKSLQMAVTIEPAGWRVLPEVAALQRRCFRPHLAYGMTTLVVLKLLPNVKFLVARAPHSQGGRVIGCGIGDRHQGQSRVINLAVDPAARRRGVGSSLLRALETALPLGDMLLMVEQDNPGAQALYQREGYVSVGTAPDYYGRGRAGIWMQKSRPGAGGGSPPRLWT